MAYPNPTANILYVELPTVADANYFIKVFDQNGRQVLAGLNSKVLNLAHLTNGSYLLRVSNANSGETSVRKNAVAR